ncbi:MAG TPA: hypothetical protein VHD33_00460, partial [Legionellaceae bacterium]|nr:hypothetical protein [Legionellaceae bacterium]
MHVILPALSENVGVRVIRNKPYYTISPLLFIAILGVDVILSSKITYANSESAELIQACVLDSNWSGIPLSKTQIENCLGWQASTTPSFCRGAYQPMTFQPLADPEAIELKADKVSFSPEGRSKLQGHVE